MLKNLKEPPFTVFGLVRFFKSNTFCLKVRFSQAQHAISDFFSKTGVFYMRLFQFFSSKSPPQFLPKMKRFATVKDSSRFSALCDFKKFAGDLQKIFSNIFWKNSEKFFPSIFCFLRFSVEEDSFFAVFSWGRMVFETYAYPFGYLRMILLIWFSKVRKCLRSTASPLCLWKLGNLMAINFAVPLPLISELSTTQKFFSDFISDSN